MHIYTHTLREREREGEGRERGRRGRERQYECFLFCFFRVARREKGKRGLFFSQGFLEQLNGEVVAGRQAFENPGSELGIAIVEKFMLQIQSLLLRHGSKAGHRRSCC